MKSVEPIEDPPELEEIRLRRFSRKQLDDCTHCGSIGADPSKKDLVVCVEFAECYVTLCPICEAELLSKLLANYLRRKRKGGRKAAKIPDIFKFESDEEEEDFSAEIPAWLGYRDGRGGD
jgi:hypothetical protein